jgi:hypothetical protein
MHLRDAFILIFA